MKKLSLTLLSLFICLTIYAQENPKQKEIGITFSDLNSFGLTYKTGTSKAMWRFNTLIMEGSQLKESGDNPSHKLSSQAFKISSGREYRKAVSNLLELRYGLDLYAGFNNSKYDIDKDSYGLNYHSFQNTRSFSIGGQVVLGLNYVFKEHLVVGAEVLPSFGYTKNNRTIVFTNGDEDIKTTTEGFVYGISNTSALLTFAYRF